VTLEPCSHHGRTPPCVDVLLAAGVRRVVYAVGDPNPRVNGAGAARLKEAGVIVEAGLMAAESEALNAGFLMRMRHGRPFIRLKSGASLDGRVALANGKSKWITSEAAREDVQHWRAQSGAVLTSAATVLADDPRLDVRIDSSRQPLRVVLDRRRTLRKTARILAPPGEVLVLAAPTATRKGGAGVEKLGAATIERVRVKRSHLDLAAVFARLAELEVNDVLVEAGPRLSGALLTAGLVDEWLLYVAPKLLGDGAKPVASLARLTKLEAAPGFTLLDSKIVGPDLRLRLQPMKKED
jgi:diaminohydroxyphosphoribosylaminopyrimidine deaminase/5-amino-6-(5-phosphoribosylamino)uracil reductase